MLHLVQLRHAKMDKMDRLQEKLTMHVLFVNPWF